MQYQGEADAGFIDVVWTDESSIQIETQDLLIERKGAHPKGNQGMYVCRTYYGSQFDYKTV